MDKLKCAKYILSYKHEYGFIADTMEILHMTQKGVTVDVYEQFCEGYSESKLWWAINKTSNEEKNII
jgi:hypothetical protein